MVGVQDIHRVNDHRGIGGVFSVCIAVLLNGIDRILKELFFPAAL